MATWWTSDTHFSHTNIIRYTNRPFTNADEMNRELITRWNAVVAPADDVWHLGDLALGSDIDRQVMLTADLRGRKRLVPGNHDRVASFYEGGEQRDRFRHVYEAAGWEIMPEEFEHTVQGHRVVVSHFPYVGDSHASHDRYSANRPVDRGLPVLHGHVHTEFAELGRQFNVGVDVRNFTPVHEDTIAAWLDQLPPVPDGPNSGWLDSAQARAARTSR